jgi:sulfopyruvate decarboxylase TPP-binding subunit
MHMVDMAFHGKDFNFELIAYLPCQLLKSLLDMRNQEYLATVFGTEYKMIVD